MALNKKHTPRLEALILEAAADIKRANPHLATAQQLLPEAEYAEIKRGRQELERIWDEIERQQGGPHKDEPAASAVDEDRGE